MQDDYVTSVPTFLTVAAVLVFVFTSMVFFSSMIGLWSAVKEGYEDGCSVFNDCVVVVSFRSETVSSQ
jgi:hypothetical protein